MENQVSTETHHMYLGNKVIPCVLLLAVNVLGGLHMLPIFIQLLCSSVSCVYLGAIAAGRLSKGKSG